jgi:AcrR family transcriptional regulator
MLVILTYVRISNMAREIRLPRIVVGAPSQLWLDEGEREQRTECGLDDVKKSYHHGELRQALVDAARALVKEQGESNFSLSDACRHAGVSTAAPYRHFADKHEILAEVAAQGFVDMTARARAETNRHPPGAKERIIALGHVYLSFALNEPALFRMMFGQRQSVTENEPVMVHGKECLAYVVQEVVSFCSLNQIAGDAQLIALQLWTLVHGAASLTIDGDYAKVAPGLEVETLMANGTERLLFSLPRAS